MKKTKQAIQKLITAQNVQILSMDAKKQLKGGSTGGGLSIVLETMD